MPPEATAGAPPGAHRPAPVSRREAIGIALILVAALSLRILHALDLRASDPFFELPAVDGRLYHEWAQQIAGGDWLGDRIFAQGPAYPYFLGALYAVVGPSLLAVNLLHALLGALDCLLVWGIGRRLFDARVGLVAAALLAGHRMQIFFGGLLVLENLMVTLTLVSVWLLVRAFERPSLARWLVAGAGVGAAALARPTSLVAGALVGAALLLGVAAGLSWPRRIACAGALAAGALLAVLPVTIRNAAVGGDLVWITSSGGLNLFLGNNPDADGTFRVPRLFPQFAADDPWEVPQAFHRLAEQKSGRELRPSEASSFWTGATIAWVRSDPQGWSRLMWRKLRLSVNAFEPWNIRSATLAREFSRVLRLPLVGFGVLAPLAAAGLFASARDARRLVPLYAVLASTWAALVMFFVLARYRLPAVPVLAIFAAVACVRGFDQARERRFGRLAALAACAAVAIPIVHQPILRENLSVDYYNLGNRYRALGHWERAIDAYRATIARQPSYLSAHNNLALVYESSGRREEAIATWRHVLEFARARNLARYVERAERHLAALRAEPSPAVDQPAAPPD